MRLRFFSVLCNLAAAYAQSVGSGLRSFSDGEIIFDPKLTYTSSSFTDRNVELIVGSLNPRIWTGLNTSACQGHLITTCVWEIESNTRSRFTVAKFLTKNFDQHG